MENKRTISIEKLVVGYGRHGDFRYQPVSCHAQEGELIALIGRNGVGKSTLLRSLAKLQQPISGRIIIGNTDIEHIERGQLAKMVSYIPAEPVRSPNTTVRDFVALARYPYHGWFNSLTTADWDIVKHAIEVVGMERYSNRFIDFLSDGERQRAMIAFAVAQDTPIVIMDEPTAFLDLPNKFEVVRLLKEQALNGKTVILSTHDIPTAFSMVDTIWLMLHDGLVAGASEDLIISNTINKLMAGSKMHFDSKSGQFVYADAQTKRARLIAHCDELRMWVAHALKRNGYLPTDDEAGGVLLTVEAIESNAGILLNVSYNGVVQSFTSIRDFSFFIRSLGG